MTRRIEVVVIGGGYAGVIAANRLAGDERLQVTLINPREVFVERMRLHQLLAGSGAATVGLDEVLSRRVRRVVDTATRITAAGTVLTAASGDLPFDRLVYAVGSRSAEPAVPGARDHALPMMTLEDARRAREVLAATPQRDPVAVVGAGITGIETAAELAEQGRSVTLVCGGPLGAYLHPRARRAVARRLHELGVRIVDGPGSRAREVLPGAVRLADGEEVPAAATIWTAGFGVPQLAARSGLRTDDAGRLVVDETLTSVDDPRIVAAGDAAAPSGVPYRMSAYSAQPMGAHAADTVLAALDGRRPARLELGFFGLCVGLGRGSATLQFARADDRAIGLTMSGRLVARLVKEGGTRGVLAQVARQATRPRARIPHRRDRSRRHLVPDEPVAAR